MESLIILLLAIQMEFKNPNEFVGVITYDNRLIVLGHGNFNKASMPKPLLFNGKYYVRIKGDEVYEDAIKNALGNFVPIKATIHSHNPNCSGFIDRFIMSEEDIKIAKQIKVNHFIIGCNSFSQFDDSGYIKTSEKIELSWIQ